MQTVLNRVYKNFKSIINQRKVRDKHQNDRTLSGTDWDPSIGNKADSGAKSALLAPNPTLVWTLDKTLSVNENISSKSVSYQ